MATGAAYPGLASTLNAAEDGGCALAVSVYRPDRQILNQLLNEVAEPGLTILVYIDGPVGEAVSREHMAELRDDRRLTLVQPERNQGLAAGLNRLSAEARARGCEWILFFDQDSEPPKTMAQDLMRAFCRLDEAGLKPAVVGPLPITLASSSKPPRYRRRSTYASGLPYRAVDFVITSGSLVNLAALARIGPFRKEYKMDAIDTEWCFRAWSEGYSVWSVPGLAMPHRVGNGIVECGFVRFPRQSPSRMLTYVRNQTHSLRLRYVPLRWKLRMLVYVPLQMAVFVAQSPGHRRQLTSRLLRACWDGLQGRFDRIDD